MERALIRVLLIEDDEDDYVITSELLSEVAGAQFKLDWVATSGEALAAMQRNEHDVYLLDYRLGERDGLDLLREAIEARVRAPIIMLTGREDRDVDVAAMNSGSGRLPGERGADRQRSRALHTVLDRAETLDGRTGTAGPGTPGSPGSGTDAQRAAPNMCPLQEHTRRSRLLESTRGLSDHALRH
jgi:CheY-like chemotaxis protein